MKQRASCLYRLIKLSPLLLGLTACYNFNPPFNDFRAHLVPLATTPSARETLIETLAEQSVQVVRYNHVMTVIIPTDKFYVFNTAELNEIQYKALMNIVSLVKSTPHEMIYVAGFNDDVGSKRHKRDLSEQRAQTMAAFLWAYGLNANCFDIAGYGDKDDIASNWLIHGSAMNRRVELQWRV